MRISTGCTGGWDEVIGGGGGDNGGVRSRDE